MTGFGKAQLETHECSISIEIKTLNSKYQDIVLKIPNFFTDKELEIKNLLTQALARGKIMVSISFRLKNMVQEPLQLDLPLFQSYYQTLLQAAQSVGASPDNLLNIVLTNFPEIYLKNEDEERKEKNWQLLRQTLEKAIHDCNTFRVEEGKMLEQFFKEAIANIRSRLEKIATREPERISNIRKRLQQQLKEWIENERFDPNRFEQELIYYLERIDFSEEKTRLQQHLDYFLETMAEPESNGKKLNFIAQEIGREINTLGAKAGDAIIQKYVVEMKDELEKIKEQVLNVV